MADDRFGLRSGAYESRSTFGLQIVKFSMQFGERPCNVPLSTKTNDFSANSRHFFTNGRHGNWGIMMDANVER